MRLYHSWLLLILLLLLTSCAPPQIAQEPISILLRWQDGERSIELPPGSSVQQALDSAGLSLGELDRTIPSVFSVLNEGDVVQIVRVSEVFEIEEVEIPFERRVLRNEALPQGEQRLLQAGKAGLQEITYRRLLEDGLEVNRSPVASVIVSPAVPEIVMVGTQNALSPVSLPGRLVYLSGGNAWLIEGLSGERRPVITSADLDGRVLRLSDDGSWLLFTRRSTEEGQINSLWAAQIDADPVLEIDLQASNVVHFAGWVPGSVLRVAYSTVEPRETAPGWQANNDLIYISFSTSGWVSRPVEVIEANAGGVYGWWGTLFSFAPGGSQLAFYRPDGVGLVDLNTGGLEKRFEQPPLQTFGDWAWVAGMDWSPEGSTLYTVAHTPAEGGARDAGSFDLVAIPLTAGAPVTLVSQTGMFAYPALSPIQPQPGESNAFQLAYLQAVFPGQSETSRYRLMAADRDGSNPRPLFPAEGAAGLEPQQLHWSPGTLPGSESLGLAVIYQGDVWLINVTTGEAQPLTADGLVSHIDWR